MYKILVMMMLCASCFAGEYGIAYNMMQYEDAYGNISTGIPKRAPKYNCEIGSSDWHFLRYYINTKLDYDTKQLRKENTCDEVLPGMYIGGHSSVKYAIKHKLVDRIVSFNGHVPHSFKGKVLVIHEHDNPNVDILKAYKNSEKFILGAKKGVLIQCAKGHSRSASICMLYLMNHYKISYFQAERFMKIVRPTVSPNAGFRKQMQR